MAPFCFSGIGLSIIITVPVLFFIPVSWAAPACPVPDQLDGPYRVDHINDGDTLTLADGRRVRFIGINSPEMRYDNPRQREPFAKDALLMTKSLVGKQVWLEYDEDNQDKYRRVLAYPYNESDVSVVGQLLAKGMARFWVIGRNDKHWRCLRNLESKARQARLGIWSLPTNQPVQADKVNRESSRIGDFIGKVTAVEYERGIVTFVLHDSLNINVDGRILTAHSLQDVSKYVGKTLLVSGRVVHHSGKYRLNVKHLWQLRWDFNLSGLSS